MMRNTKKYFTLGLHAGEAFLQALAMAFPYRTQIGNDCLRSIDWVRGDLNTFTKHDFDSLASNDNLFACEFNYGIYPMIVDRKLLKTNEVSFQL